MCGGMSDRGIEGDKMKYFTLKEIEKVIMHDIYLKNEANRRAIAFEYIDDIYKMAEFISAEVIKQPEIRCSWMIKKEFFQEVECYLLYNHKDEEFPASLQVLFSGTRVMEVQGEDLANLTIATINHILRYIKKNNPNKELPQICNMV